MTTTARAVFGTVILCAATTVTAQTPTPSPLVAHADSSWNQVEHYWRRRVALTSTTSDTVTITCRALPMGAAALPLVRLWLGAPWDRDDLTTGTVVQAWSGRMNIRWGDDKIDNWALSFPNEGASFQGADGALRGRIYQRANVVDPEKFLRRLSSSPTVAIDYPSENWYRSIGFSLDAETRAAIADMSDRCTYRFERYRQGDHK